MFCIVLDLASKSSGNVHLPGIKWSLVTAMLSSKATLSVCVYNGYFRQSTQM